MNYFKHIANVPLLSLVKIIEKLAPIITCPELSNLYETSTPQLNLVFLKHNTSESYQKEVHKLLKNYQENRISLNIPPAQLIINHALLLVKEGKIQNAIENLSSLFISEEHPTARIYVNDSLNVYSEYKLSEFDYLSTIKLIEALAYFQAKKSFVEFNYSIFEHDDGLLKDIGLDYVSEKFNKNHETYRTTLLTSLQTFFKKEGFKPSQSLKNVIETSFDEAEKASLLSYKKK